MLMRTTALIALAATAWSATIHTTNHPSRDVVWTSGPPSTRSERTSSSTWVGCTCKGWAWSDPEYKNGECHEIFKPASTAPDTFQDGWCISVTTLLDAWRKRVQEAIFEHIDTPYCNGTWAREFCSFLGTLNDERGNLRIAPCIAIVTQHAVVALRDYVNPCDYPNKLRYGFPTSCKSCSWECHMGFQTCANRCVDPFNPDDGSEPCIPLPA